MTSKLTKKEVKKFQRDVWNFYTKNKRDLPWRKTHDPYLIMVSEIMLQQTQVDRVIPYFERFTKKFPTARALSCANLPDVLRLWQGLGYNRRGKYLYEAAQAIVSGHKGTMPHERELLEDLPGIGQYTAGAIRAFAWNEPEIFIETNIRTVFTHHFFQDQNKISDTDLLVLIEKTLPKKKTREWYFALMDYGSYLKRKGVRINARSKHYTKQSKFEGSNRQIRGAILRTYLSSNKKMSPKAIKKIAQHLKVSRVRVQSQYHALVSDGLL